MGCGLFAGGGFVVCCWWGYAFGGLRLLLVASGFGVSELVILSF